MSVAVLAGYLTRTTMPAGRSMATVFLMVRTPFSNLQNK